MTAKSPPPTPSTPSIQAPGGSGGTRVQVAVRIRPLNSSDGKDPKSCVGRDQYDPNSVTCTEGRANRNRTWSYDNVFTEDQKGVFDSIGEPMVQEAFKGFNTCLFAYGQTGSGKTYCIQGDLKDPNCFHDEKSMGLIPRFAEKMLATAQQRMEQEPTLTIMIKMSYLEIYMEKVRDLLLKRPKGQEPESLEIREDAKRNVYVEGLGRHTVLSYERIVELLKLGNDNRQTAETKMNEASSRSHSIVQFHISQKYDDIDKRDTESTVFLVDLAGSERQGKTETTGLQFEEAKKINHSLLMLGRALNSFSDGKADYVSLRESKLTRFLSECFGGNSKTWMLATVSPSQYNVTETISTLEYANSAKNITNRAHINKLQREMEVKELKELVSKLEARVDRVPELEEANEKLRQKVQDLQGAEKAIADMEKKMQEMIRKVNALTTENDALKKANEELKKSTPQQQQQQQLAFASPPRGKENEVIPLTARSMINPSMYLGRCQVSIKNVLLQRSSYLTLPLSTDCTNVPMTARGTHQRESFLLINIYPVDITGECVTGNGHSSVQEALGKRVDFVVHVIGARDVPPQFSHSVHCKFVFKWAEKDVYKTQEVSQSKDPDWDYKKRFAFSRINEKLVEYFCSDGVISFEVIGFEKPQ